MNVNELIVAAGTAIGYPVEQDIYEGTSEKSITFIYEEERDSLVGDDEDMMNSQGSLIRHRKRLRDVWMPTWHCTKLRQHRKSCRI